MPKTNEQRELASMEGWIHVPKPNTLANLRG
jgi:hypothetical protein